MFDLKFFKQGKGVCGDDFNKKDKVVKINTNQILSITDLEEFMLPFSGKLIGKCATVTMTNNDCYFIREESYNELLKEIDSKPTLVKCTECGNIHFVNERKRNVVTGLESEDTFNCPNCKNKECVILKVK